MAVRVLEGFVADYALYGGPPLTKFFKQGEVIPDETLAAYLKARHCPVADVDDHTTTTCPKCYAICSRETNKATVSFVTVDCGIPFNRQYFSFKCGDVLQTSDLIDAAKTVGLPVETADGIRCPRCQELFI